MNDICNLFPNHHRMLHRAGLHMGTSMTKDMMGKAYSPADDGLTTYASMDDYADDEMTENLLAKIMVGFAELQPYEREFLIEHGYDPDTGERLE